MASPFPALKVANQKEECNSMNEPMIPSHDVTWTPDGVDTFNYRVAALVFAHNRVLLAKAATDSYWHLPGGRVKVGESASTAVRRELLEELGRKPTTVQLKLVAENFFSIPTSNRQTLKISELALYFQCDVPSIEKTTFYGPEGNDISFSWFSPNELKKVDLRPVEVRDVLFALPSYPMHLEIGHKLSIESPTQGFEPFQH